MRRTGRHRSRVLPQPHWVMQDAGPGSQAGGPGPSHGALLWAQSLHGEGRLASSERMGRTRESRKDGMGKCMHSAHCVMSGGRHRCLVSPNVQGEVSQCPALGACDRICASAPTSESSSGLKLAMTFLFFSFFRVVLTVLIIKIKKLCT